jgi:glutathione S-transferase
MRNATRLYTFTISHFCEKARWGLDRAGVDYEEAILLPGFHRRRLRQLGARKQVPVLVHGDQVIEGSGAILDFADARGGAPPLLPGDPELRAEVLEWEGFLDRELGETLRLFVYFHLLQHPAALVAAWSRGAPFWAAPLYWLVWPVASANLRRHLDIDASTARRDELRLQRALDRVEARLAGHDFLVGGAFSRADLTLAALCGPLLCPPEHPWSPPAVVVQVPEIAALAERLRGLATGRRIEAAYAHRTDDPVLGRYLRTVAPV